jgi:hypothetical protein
LAAGSGVLVLVTLYGGNDGINTLIPHATTPITTPGQSSPTHRRMFCTWTGNSGSVRRSKAYASNGIARIW